MNVFFLMGLLLAPVPSLAAPQFSIRGLLVATGGAAGAVSANELYCWENMASLVTDGYSLVATEMVPASVVAGLFALNAGCAFGLVAAGAGGADLVCRLGYWAFSVKQDE